MWRDSTLVAYGSLSDVKQPHVDLFIGFTLDPRSRVTPS
jgi:hypothetical protein